TRITRCSSEESLLTACQAGSFPFLLNLTANLRKAARHGLESGLVARWEVAGGVFRLGARRVIAEHDLQALAAAAPHRDGEHLLARHPLARAHEEALHPRRVRVVGHVELDRVALVGRALEEVARRGQAIGEEGLLAGGVRGEPPQLSRGKERRLRRGLRLRG